MSIPHPSRIPRRLVQIASLAVAGLLAGCSGTEARLLAPQNDTGWQTSQTYASATASIPPRRAGHTVSVRPSRHVLRDQQIRLP